MRMKLPVLLATVLLGACTATDGLPLTASQTEEATSGSIKARIAILFDTSGSMNDNVCSADDGNNDTGGDGSADCPGSDVACCGTGPAGVECAADHQKCTSATCGNSRADDSRMFKVKQGTRDAVAAYGEIEWGLFRFHQAQQATFVCHANNDGLSQSGLWRGATSSNNNCGAFDTADLLVDFAPESSSPIYSWMDNARNGSGDVELRGSGFTPIAGSLRAVKTNLDAKRTADTAHACRPYRVVLVTDGLENCENNTAAVAAAQALKDDGIITNVIGFASSSIATQMNAISQAGSGRNAFLATSPEELSAALAQIVSETVLVERCNGLDDDCDGVVDNGFNVGDDCDNGKQGACFRTGKFVCSADHLGTVCNAADGGSGSAEVCNGIDDNCNGLIDEGLQCNGCGQEVCNGLDDDCNGQVDDGAMPGVGEDCGIDVGNCQLGKLQCQGGKLVCVGSTGPTPEICDNIDNNCDGVVDQLQRQCYDFATGCVDTDSSPEIFSYVCQGSCRFGTQLCTAGNWSTCAGEQGPTPELCNGRDDDCDGQIDEDFPLVGEECSVGQGICHATGHWVCSPDGQGVVCDAPVVTGTTEVCNGLDDDCDGVVDDLPEPPPAPIGETCGTCGGKYVCQGGLLQCQGGSGSPEVCNGLDDDCNGLVDDGDMPDVGEACVPGAPDDPLFPLVGECRAGQNVCIAGKLQCVNFTGPQEEVCDGKDNNCDGMVDNMATCPSPGDVCYNALCVQPCAAGEFPCPFSFFCKTLDEGRFCVPSPCFNKTCGEGEFCEPNSGECVNPCAGITCPTDTVCKLGRCLDCFATGCAAGTICKADSSQRGHCVVDRCAGVTCDAGQTCIDGTCTMAACGGGCQAGEVCDGNHCVAACSIDICSGVNCGAAMVCQPSTGNCIADPCLHTNCGASSCSVACDGSATCIPHAGVDVLATGGGGVACNVTGGSGDGWIDALFVLCGLALVARRRRPRRQPGSLL